MKLGHRWTNVCVALLAGGVTVLLFSLALQSEASARVREEIPPSEPAAALVLHDSQPLGEPCGAGEQLPPWVLCLHGTISSIEPSGELLPLNDAPVTITLGGRSVTGTTFFHPGQATPTYGVDVSPLEPGFLQPVTLTAVVSGRVVRRQVVVFPDFRTQSQQYDLQVPQVEALDPAPLWGYVVHFSARGPVTGATVLIEHGMQSVTVTTTEQVSGPLPVYSVSDVDLLTIGAGPGSAVTLTAEYGGEVDRQVVVLGEEPLQANLVTGWKCDDFDPLPRTSGGQGLPRTSGGQGLPRTSGGQGLPDVACVWGYGVVDGTPRAGVQVRLEISGTVYEGETRLYAGEGLPRYGIGMWGGEAISGTVMTATEVYSGYTSARTVTVTLSTQLDQRVDVGLTTDAGTLAGFAESNFIRALLWHDGFVWAGSDGGVVRWDPTDGSYVRFTTMDGLADNNVYAIGAAPDGTLWFGTERGVSHYEPVSQVWTTYTTVDGLANDWVRAIEVDLGGALWFGTDGGVSHYDPVGREWTTYTTADGLADNHVRALEVEPNGALWVGTWGGGVSYYSASTWITYTASGELASDYVRAVERAPNGELWFGTEGSGVSRYNPASSQWTTYTTADGLAHNYVYAAEAGPDGALWFGTEGGGVSRYEPVSQVWTTYTTVDGLADNWVRAIEVAPGSALWLGTEAGLNRYEEGEEWVTYTADGLAHSEVYAIGVEPDGALWFGTDGGGISRYAPGNTPEWQTITISDGLAYDQIRAIEVDPGGVLWIGTWGGGVNRYEGGDSPEWQTFTMSEGLASLFVLAAGMAPDGRVCFGTWSSGMSCYGPPDNPEWQTFTTADGLAHDRVTDMEIGPDGALWIGTGGGVTRYAPGSSQPWQSFTTADGLAYDWVASVAVGPDGALWFGTMGGGVSRYTLGISPSWQTFTTAHGLASDMVIAIESGPDGALWFGTGGGGVTRYAPGNTPEWQTFTTADRLADNYVLAIAVGMDNALWFGTESGVTYWAGSIPKSNLALHVSGAADVPAGQTITYTLQVNNYGEITAAHTTLTFTLPPSITYLSASPQPSGTSPLTWRMGGLPPGIPSALFVTATLDSHVPPGTLMSAGGIVRSATPETFLTNNTAWVATYARDPNRADVRVSLCGPARLVPGGDAAYTAWADNGGGLDAQSSTLTITLPAALDYHSASPPPSSFDPLVWELGTIPWRSDPSRLALTVTVAATLPAGTDLAATAQISTATTPDANPLNNTSVITTSTSLTDALSLILVAPERLVERYGASPLLSRLHVLAEHPHVRGVVLDVMDNAAVRQAYETWDVNPASWQAANGVAQAIKNLIDGYIDFYPNLRYLVIVGGDDVIPFYRVMDQNGTMWHERGYRHAVPDGTIRAALAADRLLTDDYYADREATVPASPFWADEHPLYLPDFAVGRLVERPEEIMAVIDAFLANDGVIPLEPGLVGSLSSLTDDLGDAQCAVLQEDGIPITCTHSPGILRQELLELVSGSAWVAVHSNHFSLGPLWANEILNRTDPYNRTLLATIGCHTGLNVPEPEGWSPLPSLDVVQALSTHGETVIAPSAYAYGSYLGIGYSEELALGWTEQMLVTSTQEVGVALMRAKQIYYANHAWFDYTDEKVLLPVTLYGLPMLRVTTPDTLRHQPSAHTHTRMVRLDEVIVVTHTLTGLTFTRHVTADGTYYDHAGQILAQEGLPVQPSHRVPIEATMGGGTVRGIVLRRVSYTEESSFDPLLAQSWAIGEEWAAPQAEPPLILEGWDRQMPYGLGLFEGLAETVASLDLVLGAYDNDRAIERLFDGLTVEVLYSDSPDRQGPEIEWIAGLVNGENVLFHVAVTDDVEVAEVSVVCDDGVGEWRSVILEPVGDGMWQGGTPQPMTRFYVQAVDGAGNVSVDGWREPGQGNTIYLPFILREGP